MQTNRIRPQQPAVAIGFIFCLLLLFGLVPLPKILIYNRTASLPVGWYLQIPASKYNIGDLVVFSPPAAAQSLAEQRNWLKKGEPLLKRIGALGNTPWEIDDSGQFFIAETYIGNTSETDSLGRAMPRIRGKFYVGPDEFLPVSPHPGSFDGRYYGAVPLSHIQCKAVPIYTWSGNAAN